MTCLDGYQMARQGRAGSALGIAALGSFFAGCIATLILALLAPPLADMALKFGPPEYFSLMVLGLISAIVLASGSLIKALAMIVLGLLFGTAGTDANSSLQRFSFGIPELADGINFVVIAMGLFAFTEVVTNLERRERREVFTSEVKGIRLGRSDLKHAWASVVRGTALGSILGCCRAAARCSPRLRRTLWRKDIWVYDVQRDGSVHNGRQFYKLFGHEPGHADGLKVDSLGNVYSTGPLGIHVISPQGKLLGRLKIPEECTNMAWGDDDWRSLFITTFHGVYRTRALIPGIEVW